MSQQPPIRVLIADDDAAIRAVLRKIIEKVPGFAVAAEASDGRQLLQLHQAHRPQVIFLDVDMPQLSGVECAYQIQDIDPRCVLIFATGHDEYMADAFRVYAFDYLVKPFPAQRILNTLARVRERLAAPFSAPVLPAHRLLSGDDQRIVLQHRDGTSFVKLCDIILIQREERSTAVYTADGKQYLLGESLTELEEKLDPALFMRTHRCYIVNIQHIRDISPYGRWTHLIRFDQTDHDALLTDEKYETLLRRYQ